MNHWKKYIKLGAIILYGICFAGALCVGISKEYTKYKTWNQQTKKVQSQEKELKQEIADFKSKITEAQEQIEDLQKQETDIKTELEILEGDKSEKEDVANSYQKILEELDIYRNQLNQISSENQELLNFSLESLNYNFDKALTDEDASSKKVYSTLSSLLPNVLTWVFEMGDEEKNEANVDVMVSVNECAELIMLYSVPMINHLVDEINAQIDMYHTFLDGNDLKQQFTNLQVLQELTAQKPIDDSILEEHKQELFSELRSYYYGLDAVYRMYEFVLTDDEQNQNYLARMKTDLTEIEYLFGKYGQSLELNMEMDKEMVLKPLQEIKNVVTNVETKNAILPSIPIANQGQQIYGESGRGSRVYYYDKDVQQGKKLIYVQERDQFHHGVTEIIYDLSGQPIYVALNDGYVYFYDGQIVESTTELDPQEFYEAAVWLYENHDTMTKYEYFSHSLLW